MADASPKKDVEALLAERANLDQALADLAIEASVMFTDIVGSTAFFEKHGDIAGLALLQRHNDVLFPLVPAHGGRIVKTIGDSIMAVFANPPDAVRCSIAMQLALKAERARAASEEPIHVRIGIHAGKLYQKAGDVFGDTVNTASRINNEALGDEVLLSRALYERSPHPPEITAVPRGELELKGKADPMPVVGLWFGEGAAPHVSVDRVDHEQTEPKPAAPPRERDSASIANAELFVLEIQRGAHGLKVSVLDGVADKGTVKAYEEAPVTVEDLDAIARGFEAFTTGASGSYRERIREQGEALFARALSERARRRLSSTTLTYLRLHLDDELVHVPWELMHDGKQFLALKFAIGRIVAARASDVPPRAIANTRGHLLVVSNPSGDLPAAAREGIAVCDLFREGYAGEVRHLEGPVTRAAFSAALKGCTLLHFAGHSQPAEGPVRGGFRLSDGLMTAEEIAEACGDAPPLVVFANSCSTSTRWRASASHTSGVASTLLMRGVQHYIGPMWDIPDEDGLTFALRFYERALGGAPFAEAVRAARSSLAAGGRSPLSFAGYVLYGQPRTGFPEGSVRLATRPERMRSVTSEFPAAIGAATPIHGHPMLRNLAIGGTILGIAGTLIGGVARFATGVIDAWEARANKPAIIAGVAAPPAATSTVLALATPVSSATLVAKIAAPARHDGPLRVSILPFKNLSSDARDKDDTKLGERLQESVVTDLGTMNGVKFVEQAQAGDALLPYVNFVWSKEMTLRGEKVFSYEKDKLAAAGGLEGAEVLVLGAYQRSGKTARANVRLVDVETGAILETRRIDESTGNDLALQDKIADETRSAIQEAEKKLRPAKTP